jgi:hypothetical protein
LQHAGAAGTQYPQACADADAEFLDPADPAWIAGQINDFNRLSGRNQFEWYENVCWHEYFTFEHRPFCY